MAAVVISRRLSSKSNSLSACLFALTTPTPWPSIPISSSHPYPCLPLPDLHLPRPYLLNLLYFSSVSSSIGGSAAICKPYQHQVFRSFGSSPKEEKEEEPQLKDPNSESEGFKHQEIEGPTVERDLSPLANETREVTEKLMKNIYGASRAIGIMCIVQLGLGAWISYAAARSAPMPEMMTLMNAVAFGFPFSMALMLRSTLKPMHFFRKMEEIGRLQILTSTMQTAKHLNLFFFRLQGVSYLCIAGLSIGTLFLAFAK